MAELIVRPRAAEGASRAEIPLLSFLPLVSKLIDFPFNNAAPSSSIGSISAANHVAFSPRGFDPGGGAASSSVVRRCFCFDPGNH